MVTNAYQNWQNHHKVEKCPCYMRGKTSQECSVCDNRYRGQILNTNHEKFYYQGSKLRYDDAYK